MKMERALKQVAKVASRRYFQSRSTQVNVMNIASATSGNYAITPQQRNKFHISQYQLISLRRHSTLTINSKSIRQINSSNLDNILAKYDTILVDCDGVLWLTDDKTSIPGIPDTLTKLRQRGKHVLFVTNNSLPGRSEFAEKFVQYGFSAPVEDIFTVCSTAAFYLKYIAKIQGAVYAIGTSGMEFELKQVGLKYYGFGPDTDEPTRDNDKLLNMKFYDDVDAVLVGFDEYYSYLKLYKAASYLTNESCLFIGTTNLKCAGKISPTRRQPITAAIVDSVAHAAKREPTMMNKPNAIMFECIAAKFPNIQKSRTLFIGDSVRADIGFAKAVGVDSALALTGSSSLETVEENPGLEPDFILDSLAVLGSL